MKMNPDLRKELEKNQNYITTEQTVKLGFHECCYRNMWKRPFRTELDMEFTQHHMQLSMTCFYCSAGQIT